MNSIKPLFSVIFHPIEGFQELLYKKQGRAWLASVISLLTFIVFICRRQLFGFLMNYGVNPNELNIFIIFVQTTILILAFCILNWCITTLFDGKGTFRNIWIVVNYSLVPFLFFTLLSIALSNMLIQEEEFFVQIVQWIGILWSAFLGLNGLSNLHEYSFPKTIISILVTVATILILVFLIVLLLSLSQNLISFISSIVNEIILRT